MKNKKVAIASCFAIILVFTVLILVSLVRLQNLENELALRNTEIDQIRSELKSVSGNKARDITTDINQISGIDYEVLSQGNKMNQRDIERLNDLIKRQKNVKVQQGQITGYFNVNGLKITVKDTKSNTVDEVVVPEDCKVFVVDLIGLVETTQERLIEKMKTELSEKLSDNYTFVFIDGKLAHIYQG